VRSEAALVDFDRLAGTLIYLGAILGLAGSTAQWFFFPLYLLGAGSFALVLLLGAFMIRKRPEGRLLAAGAIWFALLGGAASFFFLVIGFWVFWDPAVWIAPLAVVGSALAVVGAEIKLHPLRI